MTHEDEPSALKCQGNQVLSFRVDLAPYGVQVISVEATVAFATSPNPAPLANPTEYTRPQRFTEVDDPRIQETALRLGGAAPEDVARRAYEWVANHLAHIGYVAEDRGALSALETGKGDCTESMYLFTALTRARHVPARGVEGFVIHGDAVLRAAAYHNWAEFYAGGTWHLADPQRRAFGRTAEEYVAMRIIRPGATGRLGQSRRFETLHPALEARME